MWFVHLIIICVLWAIHPVLGVIYAVGLVIYFVNQPSNPTGSQEQSNQSTFRTEPSVTSTNSDAIDVAKIDTQITYSNPYSYEYIPEVVKRLNLTGDDKKFVQRLWGRNTNFLGIEQCKDETTKLYLDVISKLKEYHLSTECSDRAKRLLKKLFTEQTPNYWDRDFYSTHTQQFINDIYKLCENAMRINYRHNRKLDVDTYIGGLGRRVSSLDIDYIQNIIDSYKPTEPTAITKQKLSQLTPSAWKAEMRIIRQKLKQDNFNENLRKDIHGLISINEYNSQFPELCLEMCISLADYDKEESLLYYMFYKANTLAQGQIVKELPTHIKRSIFKNNVEQYNNFLSLPLDLSLTELRAKIKDMFVIKRREIIINQQVVEEKRQLDNKVVTEINKILSEDEEKETTNATSLDDIFSTPIVQETIQFSELHKKFLKQFISAKYVLPRAQVDEFSSTNKIFPSMLVNEINEVFYEIYEDSLINEDENVYTITEEYRTTIQSL